MEDIQGQIGMALIKANRMVFHTNFTGQNHRHPGESRGPEQRASLGSGFRRNDERFGNCLFCNGKHEMQYA